MSSTGRRLLALLIGLAVLGIPAGVLVAACVGGSCEQEKPAEVPFCPIRKGLRTAISAGFRDGRSADVLGVTRGPAVWEPAEAGGAEPAIPWPSGSEDAAARVPIVFSGTGVEPGAPAPAGTGLRSIAPTVAGIIGLERPHPEVRSGEPVNGVASGEAPRLVLEVVWKGVGAEDLAANREAWPYLRSLMQEGSGTLRGEVGSLPLDTAAVLTTIGVGALPSEHGITGTILRDERGRLRRAWGPGAPESVLATLADDLDWVMDAEPMIGLVGTDPADRGIVGGTWYVDHDRDAMALGGPGEQADDARRMLFGDFGADDVPDLLAVAMRDSVAGMDAELGEIVEAARAASDGSLLVVVMATGSVGVPADVDPMPGAAVAKRVERLVPGPERVIEATGPGGLFLDQPALARLGISSSAVLRALARVSDESGEVLMDETFPAFSVSFQRYC